MGKMVQRRGLKQNPKPGRERLSKAMTSRVKKRPNRGKSIIRTDRQEKRITERGCEL